MRDTIELVLTKRLDGGTIARRNQNERPSSDELTPESPLVGAIGKSPNMAKCASE